MCIEFVDDVRCSPSTNCNASLLYIICLQGPTTHGRFNMAKKSPGYTGSRTKPEGTPKNDVERMCPD